MADIKLQLDNRFVRPVIRLDHYFGINMIIDTGAFIPMYFGDKNSFLTIFQEAQETDCVAIIGGLGGRGTKESEIMIVSQFELIDDTTGKSFIIHKLPIAIYDTDRNYNLDLLLSGTVLSSVDYGFYNHRPSGYMKISCDRDVYGLYDFAFDRQGNINLYNNRKVVKAVKTFLQTESEVSPCNAFQ